MDYSYLGSGKVYLREVGAAGGRIEVGNCSALAFAVTEETKEKKDYTQPGGGTFNEVRRISAVEMQLTMDELSPANLARALYGSTSAVASSAVTDEAHTAYKGAFIKFNNVPAATPAPVVTGPGGTPIYVAGTDYEVRPGGIFILEGGTITDASSILVDYTKAQADVVEALVNSGKEYELVFAGLNEARSGKEVIVTAHRVKIGAAQNIGLLGEEYAQIEVAGKLLKDTTKTGGVSQYFKVEMVR